LKTNHFNRFLLCSSGGILNCYASRKLAGFCFVQHISSIIAHSPLNSKIFEEKHAPAGYSPAGALSVLRERSFFRFGLPVFIGVVIFIFGFEARFAGGLALA